LNNLLQKVTVSIATYLEKVLPPLFEDWWNQAVLNGLSFQQKRRMEQRNIRSLAALDLAALLRVLDRNWYQISTKLDLTSEARHFVKEMQTVRNRWAHATTEGFPAEDVYRDLDTLQRFAVVIDADETFLQKVRTEKAALLTKESQSFAQDNPADQTPSQISKDKGFEFNPGQIVYLRSNPTIRGAVVSVLSGEEENRYAVFLNNETQTYYASQLEAYSEQDKASLFLGRDEFHGYLTALQIRHPGLSTLYSLNAARVDFIPYQFRPVLKFIRSDRPRLLIADGVGVGKTIEAGLILRELQARRDVRSVLIICPRPLVIEQKWQNEMKRFEERFTHLDGRDLRYCIDETDKDGVWPEQHRKVIVPFSLFDETLLYGRTRNGKKGHRKGLLDLDPPPRFDLVIVDEAHHVRNQDTYSHKAVGYFCDHAEAVVFLTATPIQLGSQDLFVLLNILRPDLVIDQESFGHMAEPNRFINDAVSLARAQEPQWTARAMETLDSAADTPWGRAILKNNPEFLRIRGRLAGNTITLEERIQIITDMENMNTFAGIISRTRRRDIGNFTLRKPETVVVEFTPSQRELHDELLRVQADIFTRIHGDVNVKFMMTTIRRQAASCLFGLAPFIEDILNRHLDELAWEEADETGQVPQGDLADTIKSRIGTVLEKAKKLDPADPKLESLRKIIRNKVVLPNNKLMLFSSFRHTLHYLHRHLGEDGFRVAMVHGGTPDEERRELRRRFELQRDDDDALDVLLFSEIGCEGLDYQFCNCIVNYDLPWNPMRVEQRIGRIDRNGQKSESVAIYNLITPDTVDADIYERCLVRIGVFNNALGGSEEILGEITREIKDIAENFTLKEDERKIKLQQLADNKIRLMQEQEVLEQRQLELFGIHLPEEGMKKEIEEASSFWLTPLSIHRLVALYLQRACGREQEYILGEKVLKTLRLSQEARGVLLKDFQKLPRQHTSIWRDWENWLKGGNPHQLVTFESECASEHPEAFFVMPLHPLAKQAANALRMEKRVVTNLQVTSNVVPVGTFEFAIYQWQLHGVKEDLIMMPVASSETLAPHFARLLEKAEDSGKNEIDKGVDDSAWDKLDADHYKLWLKARSAHRLRTIELVQYRRESLSTSHRARIALLTEQLNQANEEKIQIMRRSQIATAETDYARRVQELDIAVERADITAGPVAYGVIQVAEEE
jgi:ATP-dependent helicase HepA